jgi:chemotaxis protein histidine kinase CheA/CheY-like chemotaxis protein
VRDLSRELNKEVEFNISGDDVDMDRTLLRGIRDPLMHLLRNAIDHGIESAQIRQQRGKPERGRIDIDVESRGSQIVMRVRDDGGGIDVARLAEIARENKILSHTELDTMEREDLLDLIFRPGFSSKQIITNISGRGVGLDVVRSNLRALHGQVELETVQGQGSTFTLKLPMTLVTDHGLLVKCNNQIYAIPTTSVEKVLDVAVTDFIDLEASQAIKLNHKVIPTRRLSAILESNGPSQLEREHISVVVVAKGWDAVALIVDDVVGEREIVIKPFSQPLISVRNVIGGTLTGSGEVIMVLNPADLVDTALHSGVVSARISMAGMETTPYRILVADDSITTRMLEKNILQTAGYDVTVAVNGEEAWETLQHEPFDLVVTDVEMPITNGFELTERIKQSEKFQALPVIIVTSLSKDEERRRGIEAGADAYIVKGQFETMALLEAVGHLI